MKSEFATTLGSALTRLKKYFEDEQECLSSGVAPPEFPAELADDISYLAGSIGQYSGFQATVAESQMNRQVDTLRGSARANLVSNMSRSDFYSNAIAYLYTEVSDIDVTTPLIQATVDSVNPLQTGSLS